MPYIIRYIFYVIMNVGNPAIPLEVFLFGAVVLLFFLCVLRSISATKWIEKSIFATYIYFVLMSTVVCRAKAFDTSMRIIPCISYIEIFQVQDLYKAIYILMGNLFNVILFVPIGIFGALITRSKKKTILLGATISSFIEILQFLFARGVFEVDDILHNTLGTLVGFFVIQKLTCQNHSAKV